MHRILVSDKYKVAVVDLDKLSIDDVWIMHEMLDIIEAAESFAQAGD